jgi:hypothetical protein
VTSNTTRDLFRCLLFVSLFVPAILPAAAQTCPGINFLSAPEILPAQTGHGIGLVRESDSSYTLIESLAFPPFQMVRQTPQVQNSLASCLPIPAYTGPMQVIPQTSTAAQIVTGAYLPNSTQAIIAYTPYNRPRLNVLVVDVPSRTILSQNVYPTVLSPAGLLLADMNGDGKLDLVVSDGGNGKSATGTIDILLGNGDGTFQPPTFIATKTPPLSLTVADLNRDGILDVAVGNRPGNDVSIMLGAGDGTLRAPVNYPIGTGPTLAVAIALVAADIDGDGKPDLVFCDGNTGGGVLLGIGDGTFGAPKIFAAGKNPQYLATGDFNGDGKLDLAVADASSNAVSVLLGAGDGTFGKPSDYIVSYFPSSLVVADINNDGAQDIVVSGGSALALGGTVMTFLFGNGDGTFQGAPLYSANNIAINALALADFNGDGKPDAIVSGNFSQFMYVFPGLGGANFGAPIAIDAANGGKGVRGGPIAAGDFDRDGKQDVAMAGGSTADGTGAVAIFRGRGDGTFQPPVLYPAGATNPTAVVAADFNGDGALDLIVSALPQLFPQVNAPVSLSFLAGKGDGTFRPLAPIPFSGYPSYLSVADLNGDGKLDLVLVDGGILDSVAGGIAVYLGNGDGTFQAPVPYAAGINPAAVAVGDFNGDGKLDLVVATGAPDFNYALALFAGNGDGTFQQPTMIPTDFGPAFVAIGDFNGDGKPDIIVAHCCGDTDMTYLLGNGDGTFQTEQHFNGAPSPRAMAVADLNGDGKPDLVLAGVGFTALINNSMPPPPAGAVPAAPQFRARKPQRER